eukprot:scaffold241_cov113-Skeletonema_menzelii.AAC.3
MKGGGKLSKSELVQALNLNSNTKITNGSVSMMSGNVDKEGAVETLADAFKEDPWFVWAADIPQGTTSADKEKTMTKMNKNLEERRRESRSAGFYVGIVIILAGTSSNRRID